MFCKKCGKEIKANSKFCTNCGMNITEEMNHESSTKKINISVKKIGLAEKVKILIDNNECAQLLHNKNAEIEINDNEDHILQLSSISGKSEKYIINKNTKFDTLKFEINLLYTMGTGYYYCLNNLNKEPASKRKLSVIWIFFIIIMIACTTIWLIVCKNETSIKNQKYMSIEDVYEDFCKENMYEDVSFIECRKYSDDEIILVYKVIPYSDAYENIGFITVHENSYIYSRKETWTEAIKNYCDEEKIIEAVNIDENKRVSKKWNDSSLEYELLPTIETCFYADYLKNTERVLENIKIQLSDNFENRFYYYHSSQEQNSEGNTTEESSIDKVNTQKNGNAKEEENLNNSNDEVKKNSKENDDNDNDDNNDNDNSKINKDITTNFSLDTISEETVQVDQYKLIINIKNFNTTGEYKDAYESIKVYANGIEMNKENSYYSLTTTLKPGNNTFNITATGLGVKNTISTTCNVTFKPKKIGISCWTAENPIKIKLSYKEYGSPIENLSGFTITVNGKPTTIENDTCKYLASDDEKTFVINVIDNYGISYTETYERDNHF